MKTVQIRIFPDDERTLRAFQEIYVQSCNHVSEIAFAEQIWNWYNLQKRIYHESREQGIPSNVVKTIIRRVAASYKNKTRRGKIATFGTNTSLSLYTHRYKKGNRVNFYGFSASIRCKPDIVLSSKNQATLNYRRGKWIINQPLEEAEVPVIKPKDYLGIDAGVVNIAADSDGNIYSSKTLAGIRIRRERLRSKLQSKGTKSAKRLLKKRSGKQRRFVRNQNHIISKTIVASAEDTRRGIALEDLKGIRSRITETKRQRTMMGKWSFDELRMFIEYKAARVGIPVVIVDPRNTSCICPRCGHVDKANRKTQSQFVCIRCGFSGHADTIAARNIASRAVRNQSYADAA